ncbi:MAG TPA: hypothetical protein VI011_25810 [Asanoa sp.]
MVLVLESAASWTDLIERLTTCATREPGDAPRGLKVVLERLRLGGEHDGHIVLAGSAKATTPMIIVLFLAQRHFIDGSRRPAATGSGQGARHRTGGGGGWRRSASADAPASCAGTDGRPR